jgi:hypothetical protein
VQHLSGALPLGRVLSLLGNVRLVWKVLAKTNTLAYKKCSRITDVKSFITLGPGTNVIKLFCS